MASKDLHSNIKAASALTPRTIATDTTTAGSTIDTSLYESVEFIVQSGTLTDGAYAVSLYAGDASNMSDEAAVTTAAGGLLGSLPSFAATDDNTVAKVGYCGGKRYVRIKVVSTGTTSGGLLSGVCVLGHPRTAPVA